MLGALCTSAFNIFKCLVCTVSISLSRLSEARGRLTQYCIASCSTPPVMPVGTVGVSIARSSMHCRAQNKLPL